MLGVLKLSQQMLDTLSPELDVLVKQFMDRGVYHKVDKDNGQVYFLLDHPDFTDPDKDTEYMLYLGNRYDRVICEMRAQILRLDKIGVHGRLEPVRYYHT